MREYIIFLRNILKFQTLWGHVFLVRNIYLLIFISINIVIFEESFKNKNLLLITCLFLIILHLNLFISIGACWCGQIKDGNVFVIIKHAKIKYKGEKRVYVNNSLTQGIPVWYYSENTIPSDGAILVSYTDSLKRLNHIMCST